jgi:membrane-associated phospholipid phosphatase
MTTPATHMRNPLRAFVALLAIFSALFFGWTFAVFQIPAIAEFDLQVARTMADRDAEPVLRSFMLIATASGGIPANTFLAVAGASWLWWHHRRRFAFAWCIIALIGGLTILGLKDQFGRDRPPREIRDIAVSEDNESYPSGHAMGSVVGYGMLAFVVLQRVKRVPRRIAFGAMLAAWVMVIGLSRVYLRAHWLSDVIGGWLLGFAYVSACLAIYFWRRPDTRSGSSGYMKNME